MLRKTNNEVIQMNKANFNVSGMSCAACSARIEKELSKTSGIQKATVNLLSNRLYVEFDEQQIDIQTIIDKVAAVGYGLALISDETLAGSAKANSTQSEQASKVSESMKFRLIVSAIFTLPLFYISMGDMLNWPLPSFITGVQNSMVFALTLMLLCIVVIVVNRTYFINGFKSLWRLVPNMDSLIAIGSAAAFAYGLYATYRIAAALGIGDMKTAHHFMMNLYYESSAVILTLITFGKYLESKAKKKTTSAIEKLMDLTPETAILLRDGQEVTISVKEIKKDDILIVKEGASVPVDGTILEGFASLDESLITGESLPVDKAQGDLVIGGTINQAGYFTMVATEVGNDTALAKIIQLVDQATSTKAPIAKLADKISGVFVPIVIGIALIALFAWLLLGYGFEFALTNAISVLVISCPCALGLATPTAIMVGMGKGASNGILIKSAEALEQLHHTDVIILDKTGTVTEGMPSITDVIPTGAMDQLLSVAYSLEKLSAHPLAKAIITYCEENEISYSDIQEYELVPGNGIKATMEGEQCLAGNYKLFAEHAFSLESYEKQANALADEGKTVLYFAKGKTLLGMIAVADAIKKTSKQAIHKLQALHYEVIMVTGDNQKTANAVKKQLGLERIIAEVLPEEKEKIVRKFQDEGKKVIMVGDGINDAPALARAEVGIAIGAGTDIAIESADVVLMKNDLLDVVGAVSLSRAVMRNIKQNLFWAFIYNVIGIPIAAGVFYGINELLLNPMLGAAAMGFSSVSVVMNALRLKFFKFKKGEVSAENAITSEKKQEIKKETIMNKTLKVDGMSCMHCVGSVTKALEAIEGVSKVVIDLDTKNVDITLSKEVADSVLKKAITDAGYEVIE